MTVGAVRHAKNKIMIRKIVNVKVIINGMGHSVLVSDLTHYLQYFDEICKQILKILKHIVLDVSS